MNKTILCGLTIDEIYEIMQSSGFRMDHARATANQIYKKGLSDLSESNKLSKKLKMFIKEKTLSGLFLPSCHLSLLMVHRNPFSGDMTEDVMKLS